MRNELYEALAVILEMQPEAYARIKGSSEYPQVSGSVLFYPIWDGTLVIADVNGLPESQGECPKDIFGFHIHEGGRCLGNEEDPFAQTGMHYNPENCEHPAHAGDFPPLFGNRGYALTMFYTNRFYPEEVIGHTVVIHDMSDDFKSQPSGDSGAKIACGEIRANKGA